VLSRHVVTFVLVLAGGTPPGVVSGATRGAVYGPIGYLEGNIWEDGGWAPPLVVGDELHAVGVFEGHPESRLPWEPDAYVYTFWLRGVFAEREWFYGTTRAIRYGGPGTLGIYRETFPGDHDFGTNPPNATSPSSFADGDLVLECSIPDVSLGVDSATGTVDVFFVASYTGGELLDLWLTLCGYCFGDFLSSNGQSGTPPVGYDFYLYGMLENLYTTSVQSQTWGRVKSLYR